MENFDREFSFSELVPEPVIESVLPFLKRMGIVGTAVFLPDFTIGFSDHFDLPSLIEKTRATLKDMSRTQCGKLEIQDMKIFCFPLFHEGEPIAYFVMSQDKSRPANSGLLVNAGFMITKLFSHYMILNQKVIMTSDLHHMVVEDSFEQLKEKNQRLAASERKFRNLAQSLEIEVETKTREIQEQQAQLMHQDKLASIGQLAAGVAHEINNPLGFINSNFDSFKEYIQDLNTLISCYRKLPDLLERETDSDGNTGLSQIVDDIRKIEKESDVDFLLTDMKDLMNESKEGIDRIKKIVVTLKDFAHPGKGSMESSDINRNIDSTLEIVHNEIKYKANVEKDYGELPPLYCYPRQLNQVFMNMLINAAQAIDDFGRIRIQTRLENDSIIIRIKDTGTGIESENLSRIFDPFFTTKEVGKGTGLGLNLSYGIVKQHGGEIQVDSQPGKGTEFIISLPLNPALENSMDSGE